MATLEGALEAARPVRIRPVRNPFAVPHAPGLDGLRAIAVLAVVAYHLDLGWAGGGFLGVEVFFTLSGFLITQLLVAELRRHGRVGVRAFALARARRLVPALVAAVLGTLLVFALVRPVADLRADALFSLLYLQNWHLLIGGVPYAESFSTPSPFLHMWSLSVEAQLYLLWPLLFCGVLAVLGRRRVAAAALLLAAVSAVLCAWQFDPDTTGPAYYATDSRAAGFLVGAATALLWLPGAWRRARRGAVVFDVLGVAALVALLLALGTASEFAADLYLHGGFLRTALVTAVVLVAATGAGPAVSGLLSVAPLAALGRRSYGIYLYHWPIIVLTRDLPASSWVVNAVRVAATLVVTEASYRWLETPIRRGALRRALARARVGRVGAGVVAVVGAALVASAVLALTAPAGPLRPPAAPVAAGEQQRDEPPAPTPAPALDIGVASGAADAAAAASRVVTAAPLGPAYVLGDSISLGSADALVAALGPGTTVDAKVGRQYAGAPAAVRTWAAAHDGPIVVALGANGTVEPEDVESVVRSADGRPLVLVGVSVPRRWQDGNNAVLRAAAAQHGPSVRFVDWAAVVAGDPGLLGPDHVHPTARGRTALAEAVRAALG
ncbi:acyltransferase family protein [Pseudonocardia oroxyli]|uniref:Peptidoglycan-N-acetylmuramate O-acetyltransferase n=1 Tax=Pseudonocardia oroxyli TaxID=366584 RepID=A0A1G7DZY1_PSEOR|nr:acyltransferase family protein [Pseudonocardia oroxyli]SDE56820.1 peptidoglycan-N-acetylmuramate O-acetyltransferase [Pseudonocardia oroxyli]